MRALLGVGTASGFLQAASKTDPTKKQPLYTAITHHLNNLKPIDVKFHDALLYI